MKKVVFLLIILSFEVSVLADEGPWVPPVGIPMPSFGIKETYQMYDYEPNQNPDLIYFTSSSGGLYTHYIDANDPNATDSGNDYGSIAIPRKTVPYSLPAGSIVEIHNAGNWSYVGGSRQVNFQGTKALPIFIRGVSTPTMTTGVIPRGSYGIIEGIYIYNSGVNVRAKDGSNAHHICVRNSVFKGSGKNVGNGTALSVSGEAGNIFHNIVFYNNEVSYFGQWNAEVENDYHGIGSSRYSQYIWILDNHVHHVGGDSVQLAHGANLTVSHVYIGGNVFHDNYENAVDLKDCTDIIVSQNDMYNFATSVPVVTHYGASDPNTRGTKRAWFLFNTVHDTNYAGFSTTSDTEDIYYIGNIIYNTKSYAFQQWTHGNIYIMLNTMYNVNGGIDDTVGTAKTCVIANNIFGTISGSNDHITLEYTDYRKNAIVVNNLYSTMFTGNKEGTGSYIGDPLFTNPAKNVFTLQEFSPVNDIETSDQVDAAFNRFLQLYKIDITCDIEGLPRIIEEPANPDLENNSNTATEPIIIPDTPSVDTNVQSSEDLGSTVIETIPLSNSSNTETIQTNTVSSDFSTISPLFDSQETEAVSSNDNNGKSVKFSKIKVRRVLDRYEDLYCSRSNGVSQKEIYE